MTSGLLTTWGSGSEMVRAIGLVPGVTVAASGTNSATILLGGAAWGTFQMPSSITGTECSFEYSIDGTNWTAVPAEGTESATITITANGTYRIPAAAFKAPLCRIVMGSAQAAAITIPVFLRA